MKWMRKLKYRAALPKNVQYANMPAERAARKNQVRTAGGGEIRLASGTYHFHAPTKMSFYVSNHDNPLPRNVFLPIANVTNLVLACDGRAEFVFHGEGIALELQDTQNVTLRGIGSSV